MDTDPAKDLPLEHEGLVAPKKEEFFDDHEDSLLEVKPNTRKSMSDTPKWTVTQEGDDKHPFLTDITGLELLVARQLAALALHKYLDRWFSLEKLIQIAEGPKRSIWSKMFEPFGKSSKKTGLPG